jgi:glucokinase
MHVLGIDVGGTKVEVASVVDGDVGNPQRIQTELSDADALLDGIEAITRKVIEADGQPEAIGVGVPSQIDFATGTVIASVNIPLEGVALRDELERRFDVPVYVDNDGNCAALAEAQLVDDGPARHLVMLTLGTGVGGGVIIDGSVFRGATGLGAELGHMVIQADGPPCPGRTCPNRGDVEAYCSGSALERAAGMPGEEVEKRARAGDETAVRHMTDLGRWLGVAMANFVNIFEPEYIVIGGGLGASACDLFLNSAIEEMRSRALPAGLKRLQVSLARVGSDAGVIGAGMLAENECARDTGARDTARTSTLRGDR